MLMSDLTYKIIAAAFHVQNTIGPGFLEKIYQRAFIVELRHRGLRARPNYPIYLYHRGMEIGEFAADVIVEETVLLELKVEDRLTDGNFAQLLNYMRLSKKPVGLLINFGSPQVTVRRAVLTPNGVVEERTA